MHHLPRIYRNIDAATKAAERRTMKGYVSVVKYDQDLRNFEGGYVVEDYDDENPLHRDRIEFDKTAIRSVVHPDEVRAFAAEVGKPIHLCGWRLNYRMPGSRQDCSTFGTYDQMRRMARGILSLGGKLRSFPA